MKTESARLTHQGRRGNNEDAVLTLPERGLFVVCDGLGGYAGGEVASQLAAQTLGRFFGNAPCRPDSPPPDHLLGLAVRIANRQVWLSRKGPLSRMATTVAAMLVQGGQVVVGHIGDSRVYRYRDGEMVLLTADHTVGALRAASGMDSAHLNHVLTRAVGLGRDEKPDLYCEDAAPGTTYLLCSDGLTEGLNDMSIAGLLHKRPVDAVRALVAGAYLGGSHDNITVCVVRITE